MAFGLAPEATPARSETVQSAHGTSKGSPEWGAQNVDTVKAMYDAFGRGDVEAILERATDDVDRWFRRTHRSVRS